jgi:hypothetical protein
MNTPVLTIDERHNIEAGAWFCKLSQPLRNAILARASVRRLGDGAGAMGRRGNDPVWMARLQPLGAAHHPLWQVDPVGPDQAGLVIVRTDQERQTPLAG